MHVYVSLLRRLARPRPVMLLALPFCTAAMPAGCGGKTVVDGFGTGGGGGSSTTTTYTSTGSGTTTPTTTPTWTTTTYTSTGSGTTTPTTTPTWTTTTTWTTTPTGTSACWDMEAELETLIAEATSCNACTDYDSCWDGPKIYDLCGCSIGASNSDPEAVELALNLYWDWVDAGCGPWLCGAPCYDETTPYMCVPNGSGCGGHCEPAING